MSTDFFIRDDPPHLPATVCRKKYVMKLRLDINRLSMQLSRRIGPAIRDTADVNLAAFASAFGFARHGGLRCAHPIIYPVHARRYRGSGFSPVRMKEHDV
jgi:hypothetical protein